jgi:hypothetical protein
MPNVQTSEMDTNLYQSTRDHQGLSLVAAHCCVTGEAIVVSKLGQSTGPIV